MPKNAFGVQNPQSTRQTQESTNGHSMVRAFCRRAIEWRTIGVHVEIMGIEANKFEVCSCGLRLHARSIDTAAGHLDTL